MAFISHYVAHQPDEHGFVNYSAEENSVWADLFERQYKLVSNRACEAYLHGLQALNLSKDAIPQLPVLSQILQAETGWSVVPVAALISAREFFELLANRCFPAATFIRHREELDYIKEPDVFHELFGHCPMLMNSIYADFIHRYALMVLSYPESEWALFQRMFWFTVEFGLIQTASGVRAYGGGILSSIHETAYSIESDVPLRVYFNPIAALRTPYRIDQVQPIYFVIENYDVLYQLIDRMPEYIERARELHELPPLFSMEGVEMQNVHVYAC